MKKSPSSMRKILFIALIISYFLLFLTFVFISPFLKFSSYLIVDSTTVTMFQLLNGGTLNWIDTGKSFMFFTDYPIMILFLFFSFFPALMLLFKKNKIFHISIYLFCLSLIFALLLTFNINPYQTRIVTFVDNGTIINPNIEIGISWYFFVNYFLFLFNYLAIIFIYKNRKEKIYDWNNFDFAIIGRKYKPNRTC